MTLKKRLKQLIYPNHIHINEISDWTDSYTIEFLEWANENYAYYHGDGEYLDIIKNKWYGPEQLLEIFKKEKGL